MSSVQGSPRHRGGFWCQIGARKRIRVHAHVNSRLHQMRVNQIVAGSYAISRSQEPTTNADLETCDVCVVLYTEKASYHGSSSGCILVYWRLLHRLLDLMVPKAIGTGFKSHRRLFKSFKKGPTGAKPQSACWVVSPVPLGWRASCTLCGVRTPGVIMSGPRGRAPEVGVAEATLGDPSPILPILFEKQAQLQQRSHEKGVYTIFAPSSQM